MLEIYFFRGVEGEKGKILEAPNKFTEKIIN